MAKEAVELSRFKDKRSKRLWLHVIKITKLLNLDIKKLFEVKLSNGKTILEACIDAQDWDSCLELVFALPEGRYCDGRILRKNGVLILDENGPENQKGILATPEGSYYAGELRLGQKHGKGILNAMNETIFEGEYKNNKRHGWGVSRERGSNRVSHEGIFIEGKWIGNPRENNPSRLSGIRSNFSKQ